MSNIGLNKAILSNFVRKIRILYVLDKLRFYFHFLRSLKTFINFKRKYPEAKLPPPYLIYESFNLNYYKYYFDSKGTAEWLLGYIKNYTELQNLNILDWGCGPARVIRHLPLLLGSTCKIFGTDYNPVSIAWCRKTFPEINFNLNFEAPPLPYVENSFDVIYGISIFTHLSEEYHFKWFSELVRISKNNGILFLTFQGTIYKSKLTQVEQDQFNSGALVVRGKTKIGHRTYSAFQPREFVEKLIFPHTILDYYEGKMKDGKFQQDIWIVRIVK